MAADLVHASGPFGDFYRHYPACSRILAKVIEDRGQRTGDRRQKTDDRRQMTENRRQMTEDRRQKTENRRQRTDDRGQKNENASDSDELFFVNLFFMVDKNQICH